MLYAASVTVFFFIGGIFALLMRLELVTPATDLVSPHTYNELFSMHGIIMVWFFLIPSIPNTLGNFLIPMMIGAKDLAFPKTESRELVRLHAGRMRDVVLDVPRRRGYRVDLLHAVQHGLLEHLRGRGGGRNFHLGLRLHHDGSELHRDHSPHAGARDDLVSPAAVHLVASTPPA